MMRNRLYTKDEVLQVVEAALNALNNQSAPAREPEHLDNSTSQQSSPGTKMTLSVREAALAGGGRVRSRRRNLRFAGECVP